MSTQRLHPSRVPARLIPEDLVCYVLAPLVLLKIYSLHRLFLGLAPNLGCGGWWWLVMITLQ
jgi:hypothetical protein